MLYGAWQGYDGGMDTKTCSRCGQELPAEAFHRSSTHKSGLQSACIECRKEWVSDHCEEIRAYRKSYVEKNKGRIRAKNARYQIENRDLLLAKSRAYHACHAEELRAKALEYNAAHRVDHVEYNRARRQERANEVLEYTRSKRAANPERGRAHTALLRAVKAGTVTRENCWVCGKDKTEGHHEDYSKPLKTWWLCKSCHGRLHKRRARRLRCRLARQATA